MINSFELLKELIATHDVPRCRSHFSYSVCCILVRQRYGVVPTNQSARGHWRYTHHIWEYVVAIKSILITTIPPSTVGSIDWTISFIVRNPDTDSSSYGRISSSPYKSIEHRSCISRAKRSLSSISYSTKYHALLDQSNFVRDWIIRRRQHHKLYPSHYFFSIRAYHFKICVTQERALASILGVLLPVLGHCATTHDQGHNDNRIGTE